MTRTEVPTHPACTVAIHTGFSTSEAATHQPVARWRASRVCAGSSCHTARATRPA
ncbi:hypothetical protein [Kineococcus esterisolvens]|uniref:hypothetical protein n=1 Tax=unclassified Kineococcus TaxID=2621656 RepID=UPI003D7EFFEF